MGSAALDAEHGSRSEGLRAAARTCAVVWAGIAGLVALIVTVEVFVSYVRGPTNSGDVPSSVFEVVLWSVVVNLFLLPATLLAGVVAGLVVGVIRRGVRRA